MSKFWTILVGTLLVSGAQAQTTDFKWSAELRTRYTNNMNAGFVKTNEANFAGRTKIGVTMLRGDTLTGHVSLLHNNMWGDQTGLAGATGVATHNKAVTANLMLVQEAWGWWKSNEMFSMKFGRAGFEYGDGAIFSFDDWQATPNSWEGVWTQWTFDFADLHIFGTKLVEPNPAVTTTAGNTDPEVVGYGMVVHFKNLPEFLKHGFVHVVTINGDESPVVGAGVSTAPGAVASLNRNHFGLTAIGDAGSIDYRLTADFVSGKIKLTAPAVADVNLASNMMDFELGWNMPEFMKARLALMAHMDTGDDGTTADKNERYTPLFYDTHKFAGLQDIVGWGNSTYYGLGFTVTPSDDLTAGLAFLMFNRSTDKDAAGAMSSAGTALAGADLTKTAVGSEIDVHLTKTYGENFSMLGFLGMFSPGEYIKGGGSAETYNKLQLQAKLNF